MNKIVELRTRRKLRCEALRTVNLHESGCDPRCSTNGEPIGAMVLCWTHRKRLLAGRSVPLAVPAGQTLKLLFAEQKR